MARLFPFLRWFWGAVVFTIIVGAATNRLSGGFDKDVLAFLYVHWILVALPFVGIAAVTFWSWLDTRRHARQETAQQQWQAKACADHARTQRTQQLHQSFALFKPAPDLCPEDVEFQPLTPGETIDPRAGFDKRPFYTTYIPRRAIAHDHLATQDDRDVFDEERLANGLSQGRGFVLLGPPLDGKTRTLYEVVKRLAGYEVVRPRLDRPTPPDEAFALLKGHRVILLLEDLNSYASRVPDLREFAGKLGRNADTWTVAATCRDGPELGAVREAIQTTLRRFYEDIPLKLGLLPLTIEEKAQLARGIGRRWSLQEGEYFPTPGSITMEEALKAMRERFETLAPDQKSALRGLKLLTAAGILPLTHRRLQAILEHLFNRTLYLGDCLDGLTEQSFIRRPASQDPIQPEPAYLQGAVAYTDGRTPQDDFSPLGGVLEAMADVEGLFYLGNSLKKPQDSFAMYERALELDPEIPEVWYNKGVALERLERYPEALQAYERALELDPEAPKGWHGKGVALERLERYPEALQAYERALELDPEAPKAWHNKGVALAELERYPEALQAYEQALELDPEFPEAWHGKAWVLQKLGRDQEVQQADIQAKQLRLGEPSPNH